MGIDPGRMKEWGSNPRKMMVGGCLLRIRPPFLCILRLCLPGCSPCFAKRDVTGQVGSHPMGWEVGTGRMCFTYDCNFRFFCLARKHTPSYMRECQTWDWRRCCHSGLKAALMTTSCVKLRHPALTAPGASTEFLMVWMIWDCLRKPPKKLLESDNWPVEFLERLRYLSMPKPACSSWFPTLPNTWSLL